MVSVVRLCEMALLASRNEVAQVTSDALLVRKRTKHVVRRTRSVRL